MARRAVSIGLGVLIVGTLGGVLTGFFLAGRPLPDRSSAARRASEGPPPHGDKSETPRSVIARPGQNLGALAETPDGEIRGTVYNALGERADGALVYVVPSGKLAVVGKSQFTATCDATGFFSISSLDTVGHFAVSASFGEQFGTALCQLTSESPVADVAIVLAVLPAIKGQVVSSEDLEVADARIQPYYSPGEVVSNSLRIAHEVVSDNSGAFVLRVPSPTPWTLYVTAEGYSPTFTTPIMSGTQDARVVLEAGFQLSGQVMLGTSAAQGAEVVLSQADMALPQLPTRSDADGAFHFSSLAPGKYGLSARLGNSVAVDPPLEVQIDGGSVDGLLVYLEEGGVVKGRLVEQETGNGIGGVRVSATASSDSRIRRSSDASDDQGHYEIHGLTTGQYRIIPDTPPVFKRIGARSRQGGVQVQIQVGEVQEGIDLYFARRPVISGRVLDQSDNPVAGAEVRGTSDTGWTDRTRSAHDGAFTLTGVEIRDVIRLHASTPKLTSKSLGPLEFPESGLADLELILAAARDGLVAGVVQNSRSEPVRLRVSAWADEDTPDRVPNFAETDVEGRFLLPNLPPGNYELVGQPGDGNPQTLIAMSLRAGQQIRGLRLIYESDGLLELSGTVTDANGSPVQAALQLFQQDEGALSHRGATGTGIEGTFLFSGLRRGDYTISVTATAYAVANVGPFAAGSKDVTIQLVPNPRIIGQVLLKSGEPVKSFGVAAIRSNPGEGGAESRQSLYQSVTHPNGQFELSVEPGDYEVIARADGHGSGRTAVGHIRSGTIADGIVVVLEPRKRYRGRVLDTGGQPVAGAAIFAGPLPARVDQAIGGAIALSDADGYFEMTEPDANVAPHWSAYHEVAGFGEVYSETAGADIVTIEMHAAASLSVEVSRGGASLPGATVFVENMNGKRVVTTNSDSDGNAVLSNLPPGEFLLGAASVDGEFTETKHEVLLSSGEETHVRLEVD